LQYFSSSKKSSSSPSWFPSTIVDPCIYVLFNFHGLHHKPSTFYFLWFHLGGGGPFNEEGSFHYVYQNNNWWRNNQVSPWSYFLVSWSYWRYHFWLWASICIQVLKVALWTFRCEGDIVINFPP
jgi:hypothetical protein